MDTKQCKAVIAEHASVIVDAVGKISEDYTIHSAHLAVETVHLPGREEERGTGLEDTRDTRNCPSLIFGVEMEHDAPCNRSIENAIGEWTGLRDATNRGRFGAVISKTSEHRARAVEPDECVTPAQQRAGDGDAVAAPNIENTRSAWDQGCEGGCFPYTCPIVAFRRIPLRDQVVLMHLHFAPEGSLDPSGM